MRRQYLSLLLASLLFACGQGANGQQVAAPPGHSDGAEIPSSATPQVSAAEPVPSDRDERVPLVCEQMMKADFVILAGNGAPVTCKGVGGVDVTIAPKSCGGTWLYVVTQQDEKTGGRTGWWQGGDGRFHAVEPDKDPEYADLASKCG